MKLWQEVTRRATALKTIFPISSPPPHKILGHFLSGGGDISSSNKFNYTRRVFLIRGYQTLLQLYLFLDNSSY